VIVLDEQLLGRGLEQEIRRWYHGPVCFIIDLRPQSIIKDEAVPVLLRRQARPTFVTINERDFWHDLPADDRYSVVCFAMPDSRVKEVPARLRDLFRRAEFRTKAQRVGMIIRVTDQGVSYYTTRDRTERYLP
jgi:hypothetical protein